MIQLIIRIYRKLLFSISKSARNRYFLYMKGLRENEYTLKDNDQLFLKKLGLTISLEKHLFIINGYSNLLKLKKGAGAKFALIENSLFVEIFGLVLIAKTLEEFFILWEVFVNNSYNMDCAQSLIVLDIGMNVGYTSLFLATKNNIIRIYGYEPFNITYKDALENFKLNPIYSKKITPINCGVGNDDKEINCDFSQEWKGKASIEPLADEIKKSSLIQKEVINLLNIEKILHQVSIDNPDVDIAIKIDCEGSEYEILEKLYKSKSFDVVKILMLEWHRKGKISILGELLQLGFKTVSFDSAASDIGMIYAFR